MAKNGWPKELADLMDWCIEEAASVRERIQERYAVTISKADEAAIAKALLNGIADAFHRKGHQ